MRARFAMTLRHISPILALFSVLFTSSCIQNAVGVKKIAPVSKGTGTYIAWGKVNTVITGDGSITSNHSDSSKYCFDNGGAGCISAASPVSSQVFSNPVAIKGFQLVSGRSIATPGEFGPVSSYFVTAEPRVDMKAGTFVYYDAQFRHWNNSGAGSWEIVTDVPGDCIPNQDGAVGFAPIRNSNNQRILTGISAFTDGNILGAFYNGVFQNYSRSQAFLKGGKVWYAGMIPSMGNPDEPFRYGFAPSVPMAVTDSNFATSSLFGDDINTEPDDSSGYALPRVGLTSADQSNLREGGQWFNHVIIGYCFKGVRHERHISTFTIDHPIVFGFTAQLYQPVMESDSSSSTTTSAK